VTRVGSSSFEQRPAPEPISPLGSRPRARLPIPTWFEVAPDGGTRVGNERDDAPAMNDEEGSPSVAAVLGRLEDARRELEIAEATRRSRADDVARLAEEVESSIAQAIDETTAECDELERRLRDAKHRLRELEVARSEARIERLSRSAAASVSSDNGSESGGFAPRDVGLGADPPSEATIVDVPEPGDTLQDLLTRPTDATQASDASTVEGDLGDEHVPRPL
jgi:hypothetical protein